jgi:hypothetical protein
VLGSRGFLFVLEKKTKPLSKKGEIMKAKKETTRGICAFFFIVLLLICIFNLALINALISSGSKPSAFTYLGFGFTGISSAVFYALMKMCE